MWLLALDTALDASAAAVAAVDAAGRVVTRAERTEMIGKGHAERLLSTIEAVLAEAGLGYGDLGRIGVTVGPGSFTGIRVGLAAARGFGLALGVPVVGVGTLDALAASTGPGSPLLVALDARRGEVYARLFDAEGRPVGAAFAAPAAVAADLLPAGPVRLAGSGARLVAAEIGDGRATIVSEAPVAPIGAVAALAARLDPVADPPKPLYVRPPDAKPQTAARVARVGAAASTVR